jgi:phenylacetate-CoA ligase
MNIGFQLIDFSRNTNILREFDRIKKEYRLSQTVLLDTQRHRLSEFLLNLKTNPSFSRYLDEVTPNAIVKDPVSVLANLPITDKTFIRNHFMEIFIPERGRFEHNYTGGSTGAPFHYVQDKISVSRIKAFNYLLWDYFLGYRFGDPVLVVGGASLGVNTKWTKRVYNYLQNRLMIPGDIIDEGDERNLRIVLSSSFRYIYGYPSSILQYVRLAKRKKLRLKRPLHGVITTSEMLYLNMRKELEDFFNCRVLNIYGANDGGIISGSADNHPFHYNGLDCFVEVLPNKEEESAGGELLLTNLNSFHFPFVRYRVGDIGRIATDTGNEWPFQLSAVEGRAREMIRNTKGRLFHGSLFNKLFKNFDNITQYQIIQKKDAGLRVNIICENIGECESLQLAIHEMVSKLIDDPATMLSVVCNEPLLKSSNLKTKIVITDDD